MTEMYSTATMIQAGEKGKLGEARGTEKTGRAGGGGTGRA